MVHIVKLKYTNKNKINWKKVENELKRFINKSYINNSTNNCIHIDNHSIDELTHSNYTINLKGRLRLIKANLVFYLDLIISEMDNERWKEDIGNKHKKSLKMVGIDMMFILLFQLEMNMGNILIQQIIGLLV